MRKTGLKLQPDKCEYFILFKPELEYLGHLITKNEIKSNPNKIKVVRDFNIPKIPIDVKSFLGLTGYYRKFIQNCQNL